MARWRGTTGISWVVLLAAGLTITSALLLLAAPLGYRLGIFSLRLALQTLLRWGVYLAVGAAVVSLIGLIVTLATPKERRRGLLLAVVSFVVAAAVMAIPARFRMGPSAPPIHDITTDTQDPPQYIAVVPLRANAPNTTEYGGERVAAQQRAAYPDVQPAILNVPPARAFERTLAAVHDMGWEVVKADAAAGRIEATDTTFWFGFKDDVVIRIKPTDGGSRVVVGSLSRVGVWDAGTNAMRFRVYLQLLTQEDRTAR